MKRRVRSMYFSAFVLAGSLCADGVGRDVATLTNKGGGIDTLSVEAPRPMATAVQKLNQTYGYRISYEDPRYVYAGDLVQMPAARLRVPKGGRFTAEVQPSKGAEAVLEQTIVAFTAATPGLRFQLRKDGAMYHVVPAGARDRNGHQIAQTSILDTAISLPAIERNAYDTIVALCRAISAASGVKVEAGMTGFEPGASWEPTYSVGAAAEPARAVLKRALDEIAKDRSLMTWTLLFGDQTTDNAYALNLFRVTRPVVTKPVSATLPGAPAP
jgi:hypothetical protein